VWDDLRGKWAVERQQLERLLEYARFSKSARRTLRTITSFPRLPPCSTPSITALKTSLSVLPQSVTTDRPKTRRSTVNFWI
jgi:hypothetical protein